MTTVDRKIRYRIAISTSVRGIKTFDCTVDAEGLTQQEILKRSDDLVKELDARYPPGGAA